MLADWSERPLRIVQTNLQVRDTDAIEPERLARQVDDLGANVLVFNAGGIYAWYDTDVTHHRKNPHLPTDRDLLGEVIEACHDRDVAFVARVDFSKADDEVYARRPEWFAREPDGTAPTIGAERPGGWPILRPTCLNSAYRKDAVAIPVLEEVLTRYDVDGIFYNAPHYVRCHCDTCRRRYRERYGEALPDDPDDVRAEWPEHCVTENMERRHAFIQETAPDVEMVLYYDSNGRNLESRAAATDLLCTESQNVLSRGHDALPERWKPVRTMLVANTVDGPPPVGIVHSSPGMDWRHAGLPPAEYEYWLSQVPAGGGHLWHSLTGVPDTIADDRLLDVVSRVNGKVERIEGLMAEATSAARTVLLWNASDESRALLDGLVGRQVPVDLLLPEQVSADRLADYDLAVVPAGWEYAGGTAGALRRHVEAGGRLLVEGTLPGAPDDFLDLLGVASSPDRGEDLVAAYSRFEGEENPLQRGLEATDLLPHRGRVAYCDPADDAAVLLTLVPQWSPIEAVGRPPERASLPVEHTDVPTAVAGERTLYLPFSLSGLLSSYRLADHARLLGNAVDHLLGERRLLDVAPRQDLGITAFETSGGYLLHLVNAAGRRPLQTTVPRRDVEVGLPVPGDVAEVRSVFDGEGLAHERDGDRVRFTVPSVPVWEAVHVRLA